MINTSQIPLSQPLRIIIGAGKQRWSGWIATQRENLDLLLPKEWEDSFHVRPADAFLCEHVWGHLTEMEGRSAANLCYKYLKPGGYLRCAVPDVNFPDQEYQKWAQVGGPGPKDLYGVNNPFTSGQPVGCKNSIHSFRKGGFF